MTDKDHNSSNFDAPAELARSLGNPHRLALLELLAQGERPVDRLAELSGLSVANTSQHLQQLRRSGFVQTRREGKYIFYRLGDGPVLPLLTALRHYSEYHALEIQNLVADSRHQRNRLEAISRQELLVRMEDHSITLLDVRPEDEYAHGHLPGALNIPLGDLEKRLSELPQGHEVIAYCRGPYCVLSVDAVKALKAKGIKARLMEDGFPEWKAAGLKVEAKPRR